MEPLLPKLIDRPNIVLTKTGVWEHRSLSDLNALIVSLKVEAEGDASFLLEIDAIPDIWARALLFETALYDNKHLLHNQIVGEWRGLLAMLAFREIRADLRSYLMVKLVTNSMGTSNNFRDTLKKLLPTGSLDPKTNWNNLYVILVGDQPIGMTSPTTLVCTATEYYIKGLTWYDGFVLKNPLPFLTSDRKKELGGWLESLYRELAELPRTPHRSAITELINEYINDIGEETGTRIFTFEPSNNSFGMTPNLFQALNYPISDSVDPTSHVRLISFKEKISFDDKETTLPGNNVPGTTLVLADPEVAHAWGKKLHEINIIGATTLDDIPYGGLGSEKRGNKIGNLTLPVGIEWIAPDYFFTNKFFVIKQENALPGAIGGINGFRDLRFKGETITPILPITEELLEYFDYSDIAERVFLENTNDGLRVKLLLTLSGNDKETNYEVKKEYKISEGQVIKISNLPILEVWPNFSTPSWKAYYSYYDLVGQENSFYAKPIITNPGMEVLSEKTLHGKEIEREITYTDSFPRAFQCATKIGSDPYPAGIILLKEPIAAKSKSETWKMGIDFGTSGTNAYSSNRGLQPQQMVFRERLHQVTDSGANRAGLYKYFMQDNPKRTNAFLSIFHHFREKDTYRPILDGHIFFLQSGQDFKANESGMDTNLKWGGKNERSKANAFLEQLCLQCSAEAVFNGATKISWRYSFPTAFSTGDMRDFTNTWVAICKSCNEKTGLIPLEEHPYEMSESVAAAHFFAYHDQMSARLGRGAVCVDIGGGTSDISIWQGTNISLIWQTSILYASRDIFLRVLYQRPELLAKFSVANEEVEFLKSLKGNHYQDAYDFKAQVDYIMSRQGADFIGQLSLLGSDKMVAGFISIIAVGLSGLFYYIGLLLKDRHAQGEYTEQMPDIFFGGNGSQIFKWVYGGETPAKNVLDKVNNLYKQVLKKAMDFKSSENDKFEIKLSPMPKAEVAYGLAASELIKLDFRFQGDAQTRAQGILAGEDFYGGFNAAAYEAATTKETKSKSKAKKTTDFPLEHSWNNILSTDNLNIKISPKLEQFNSFIGVYNAYADAAGLLQVEINKKTLTDIKVEVDCILEDTCHKPKDEIQLEPLFILALKKFLEVKANDWAQKYEKN